LLSHAHYLTQTYSYNNFVRDEGVNFIITVITIPGKPPLLNMAFATDFKTGRRFKTKLAVNYEKIVISHLLGKSFIVDEKNEYIKARFYLYSKNLITSKNAISKTSGDWDGRIKILQDYISKGLGFNDALICSAEVYKLTSKADRTIVVLETRPLIELLMLGDSYENNEREILRHCQN